MSTLGKSPRAPDKYGDSARAESGQSPEQSSAQSPQLPLPPEPREILVTALRQGIAANRVLFSFDFDGTLVDLAPSPDAIDVPESIASWLTGAAKRGRVLMITGRALHDLQKYIPSVPGLDMIGNHGLEWCVWRDGKQEWRDLAPPVWYEWRNAKLNELNQLTSQHGGWIEDKQLSLSIHYRGESPWWLGTEARDWFARNLPAAIQLVPGKQVWNVAPAGRSKGEALAHYLSEFGFSLAVYFGDEPTDETVFERKDLNLIGIKVAEGPTAAHYRVPDVRAVRKFQAQLSMLDKGLM